MAAGSPRAAIAWAFHRAVCRAGSILPTECAYGDCPMPGYPRHALAAAVEHGVIRYHFCSPAHREAWLDEENHP